MQEGSLKLNMTPNYSHVGMDPRKWHFNLEQKIDGISYVQFTIN